MEYTGFGVDVALHRADDIDKHLLTHVARKPLARVLELGCGAGGQTSRLAAAGASVTAVDIHDYQEHFTRLALANVEFLQADVRALPQVLSGQRYTDVCAQRILHYLPFEEAVQVLKFLHTCTDDRLYLSVTGLASAIGEVYPAATEPITMRFASLPVEQADIFQIEQPICLYSKMEFQQLLSEAGWLPLESWQSAFGNHKAVCVRY